MPTPMMLKDEYIVLVTPLLPPVVCIVDQRGRTSAGVWETCTKVTATYIL